MIIYYDPRSRSSRCPVITDSDTVWCMPRAGAFLYIHIGLALSKPYHVRGCTDSGTGVRTQTRETALPRRGCHTGPVRGR